MPITIPAAFETLHSWLTPSTTESTSAASHRASIKACLENSFGMTNFFRSGSFGHGTSISGYSDVDYMAVLPRSKLSSNSSTTLQKVRDALVYRFPRTAVSIRSPAVVVPFGNKISERHEITPADYMGKTNGSSVYEIPNRYGEWMTTSPHAHGEWINSINLRNPGTKALIRFIKLWNYKREGGIRSFYLEMRVAQYAANESYISYPVDVWRALNFLRNKELAAMKDPTGLCGSFYPCSDAMKSQALSKLDTAIARAERAYKNDQAGNVFNAFEDYGLLFNGHFPRWGY
ncbi:hypothetical protein MZK49_07985 [Ensifer sesbaniae]|uniref:SMODS domain-containing nucleotidyltransferase n=1 Tax=Ensifer sesbaniae TaxID=1214071 RepID=UPI0020006C8B|nr:hypothetical protein [Ensifer sesbaniae]